MKINLPNAITTRAGTLSIVAQKNSPKLLFGAGIVLFGATVVSAAQATLKLDGVLYDIKHDHRAITATADSTPDKWTQKEITKLHAYVSVKGVLHITKLYLPTLSLGVAAISCLTISHNQLTRRNAGLSAALAATERALDKYRHRIREEFGEEKELKLWRGEGTESEAILDDEGRETKSKKKVKVGGGHSPYACLWGRDTSSEWDPTPGYNVAKLRSVQEYATLRLNSRGHLFLNEVLDELGLPRTPAGAVVGWLSQKNGGTDGYVDFGVLVNGEKVQFVDFLTGDEEHIWVDFNVDGEIWRNI
jgi:hypothetical protein